VLAEQRIAVTLENCELALSRCGVAWTLAEGRILVWQRQKLGLMLAVLAAVRLVVGLAVLVRVLGRAEHGVFGFLVHCYVEGDYVERFLFLGLGQVQLHEQILFHFLLVLGQVWEHGLEADDALLVVSFCHVLVFDGLILLGFVLHWWLSVAVVGVLLLEACLWQW
jgi:hypothetical protein